MNPVSLLFLLIMTALPACPARAEQLWLVVGASDATPAGIARKARAFGRQEGLIIRTADCGERKNIYAWAARLEATKTGAEAAVEEIRKNRIRDAFVRSCAVKPGSLLAHRIPAVDSSIAEVPDDAVNWEDADKVSTVKALADGRSVAIIRYYESGADDPLEGRRERVMLLGSTGKHRELQSHCLAASGFKTAAGYLAFHCATEQAGDHLMHSVFLFDKEGRRMKELRRCRNPRFAGGYLYCKAESVKAEGNLELRTVRHRISR